ncbi:MAG: hypothetical protein H0U55_10060 [Rubrobacteraceae bacterium]|nr:hypothetical protein [Rubrobacteraceae bacterium]
MTLIITAVDKGRIIQVSDRRLTWPNGKEHDGNANKAVCVGMGYIHFATSYTGLAYMAPLEQEESRTDYWLLDALGDITRYGQPRIESICDSLGDRAARTLSRLAVANKGLTFVMAGYEGDDHRPFRATVSNMKSGGDPSGARERFVSDVRRFYPWDPKPDIHIAGAVAAFESKGSYGRALKRLRLKVEKHLRKRGEKLNELQVAQVLVSLVGAATTHPTYGHLISKNCLSVEAFPPRPGAGAVLSISLDPPSQSRSDTLFTSHYFSVGASPVLYGPMIADPYFNTMSLKINFDPEIPDEVREPSEPSEDV